MQRVHLNLAYFNNASARFDERSNGYKAIIGYSQRLGPQTIFVTDYARQQEKERYVTTDIVEVGLRYQQTPLTALSVGHRRRSQQRLARFPPHLGIANARSKLNL